MRKILVMCSLALGLLAMSAAPAGAILWGEPDGNGHPYVGMLTFYDDTGEYMWRCTGTLLSPTVVLTAGHCTYGTDSARAYFDPTVTADYPNSQGGTPGTPDPHPDYGDFVWPGPVSGWAYIDDVGVVVLDDPVTMGTYGQLAPIGYLDGLAKTGPRPWFTIVGYGVQDTTPVVVAERTRYVGSVWMRNLNSALNRGYNIQLSSTAKSGGLCFGDSGGPVFHEDSTTIVAVNSFVQSSNCTGNGWSYRVDLARSQDWVNGYLT